MSQDNRSDSYDLLGGEERIFHHHHHELGRLVGWPVGVSIGRAGEPFLPLLPAFLPTSLALSGSGICLGFIHTGFNHSGCRGVGRSVGWLVGWLVGVSIGRAGEPFPLPLLPAFLPSYLPRSVSSGIWFCICYGYMVNGFSTPTNSTLMILPQVHLRKPCYDFYFL